MSTSFDSTTYAEVDTHQEERIVQYVPPQPPTDYAILASSADVPEAQFFERVSNIYVASLPASSTTLWTFSPVIDGRPHAYSVTITAISRATTAGLVEHVTLRSTITVGTNGFGSVSSSAAGDTLVQPVAGAATIFTTAPTAFISGLSAVFRLTSAVAGTDVYITARVEIDRTM